MRILTVSNLYPPDSIGGWELGCAQMVDELRGRGHDVRVLTSTPRAYRTDGAQPHVRRVLDVEESWDPVLIGHDTPAALVRRMLVNAHNIELLHQEVDAYRPEVVYLWNLIGLGAAGIALAVELRGIPWVVHLMDAMPRYIADAARGQHQPFAVLLNRRLTGAWIACSQRLVEEITEGGAPLSGEVVAIPNWVTGPRPAQRDTWFKPGRTLRCVYTGQVVASKGIGIILNTVARLRGDGYAIEVDLFGDGPDRAGFEAHVIGLGLVEAVRFRGLLSQSDLLSELAGFDVMLYPTAVREPFGFAPLEAAARGCVPLVTAGSGITEWLVEGVHLLTAPADVDGFATALRDILIGETDLAPIGRRGQRTVLQDFHIEAIAPRVESLLEQAANRPIRSTSVSWQDIGRMARIAELLSDQVFAHL
jgi:glycogen(starch) synthase